MFNDNYNIFNEINVYYASCISTKCARGREAAPDFVHRAEFGAARLKKGLSGCGGRVVPVPDSGAHAVAGQQFVQVGPLHSRGFARFGDIAAMTVHQALQKGALNLLDHPL